MSFLCALPLAARLIASCASNGALAVGYVEGDFVRLAPMETARVERVLVAAGDRIEAGDAVAELHRRDAELAVASAEATLAEAEARLADLSQGKRPEEIAVLQAALASAEAGLTEAERVRDRSTNLNRSGIAADAERDRAETAVQQAKADVEAAVANLAVARLPARAEEIEAARSRRDAAKAALAKARWQFGERTIRADADGRITEVVRHAGDVAGPQGPVATMLPDGALRLVLYLPEPALSSVDVGTVLAVSCDGCAQELAATVSHVASEPEFTPPVIYSLDARQKLVYRVEARPANGSEALKPGQIVDVGLAEAPSS